MKVRNIYLAALLCAGLVGCSQSDDSIDQISKGEVDVKFNFGTMASVANESTRSAETTGEEETGSEFEYKVNNVIVYFFDANTKLFAKSIEFDKLAKMTTADKFIAYVSETKKMNAGTYDIFAVANTDNVISANTEMQFLGSVDADTYKAGRIEVPASGFIMTNRGNANLGQEIKKSDNTGTEQTINITLERAVARLEVATEKNVYELKNTKDEVYANVNLNNCYFINLPTSFYNFRHVAALTSLTQPTWSISNNFTDIPDVNGYAIDPYFFKKTVDATGFTNADNYYANFACSLDAEKVVWNGLTASYDDNQIYSLENCMIQNAQKNGYTTGVLFKSEMTPNDNVFEANGTENVKVAQANYPSKLYYFNYNFYTSIQALANLGLQVTESMTEKDLLKFDVKVFYGDNGKFVNYYRYWIRHVNNNNDVVMGVMEFGIVRNNLYRMKVVGISGLGSGNIEIEPDILDEDETFIKVTLNVKPWIVRDNTDIIL